MEVLVRRECRWKLYHSTEESRLYDITSGHLSSVTMTTLEWKTEDRRKAQMKDERRCLHFEELVNQTTRWETLEMLEVQ